jgi:adenosylhomocysteine nucleosidase
MTSNANHAETQPWLDPVDPIVETAVGAEMERKPHLLVCCPLAVEFECVRDELRKLWSLARFGIESKVLNPALAPLYEQLSKLDSEFEAAFPEAAARLPDEIDAQVALEPMPGLDFPNLTCHLKKKKLLVIQSGLGRRTERTASRLLGNFSQVWLIGFAGSLEPSLIVGDVIEPKSVASSARIDDLIEVTTSGICVNNRPLATAAELVSTPAEKQALHDATKCSAVDMEAYDLACLCRVRGIAFHTARAISDGADEAIPRELEGVVLPSGDMSMKKLCWALLKKPSLISTLNPLWRNSKKAKEGLRLITRRLVEKLA